MPSVHLRGQLWGLWALFLASVGIELAILQLARGRAQPWHDAQTAVAGFVLALLALTLGVSTFAQREKLGEARTAPDATWSSRELYLTLLALWTRCLVIGLFGAVLAYGAASPRAAWPFLAASAALLVLHAPRAGLFARPER